MKLTLNTDTIKLITFFENLTGAPVKDCLIDEKTNTIYFLIEEGKIGLAIGKNGNTIKNAERMLKRRIRVIEFSTQVSEFIKKFIPQSVDIRIKSVSGKKIVEIKIEKKDKAFVIGRNGSRLKLYKELLHRNYGVDDVIIR